MRKSARSSIVHCITLAATWAAIVFAAHPAAAQTALPRTACDAALENEELHPQPAMPLEDGTQAFSYVADGAFVSGAGSSISLAVTLLFEPGPDATIRVSALDDSCGGANNSASVFSYTFSDLQRRNTVAYDVENRVVHFNGSAESVTSTASPRYLFVDVWDGALPSTRATHSYLVDLQNPRNP